jgi:large subunit ribosomal protein L29
MKVKDLRQLSGEELQLELERVQRHLFDLRSQAVTEKLEDPSMLTKAKRDMARILTVQREREIVAEAGQPAQAKA